MTEAYNIDCMEYMKNLPDNAFDLAIVDPPYGDASGGKADRFGGWFEKYRKVERTDGAWASKYGKAIVDWDIAPTQEYFTELRRVSKNQVVWGGIIFYFHRQDVSLFGVN